MQRKVNTESTPQRKPSQKETNMSMNTNTIKTPDALGFFVKNTTYNDGLRFAVPRQCQTCWNIENYFQCTSTHALNYLPRDLHRVEYSFIGHIILMFFIVLLKWIHDTAARAWIPCTNKYTVIGIGIHWNRIACREHMLHIHVHCTHTKPVCDATEHKLNHEHN